MNPDENKNDNSVNGAVPQVPDTQTPVPTPPAETPESTAVPGFDATGDAPGDVLSPPAASVPGQPVVPEPSSAMPDPSAGLPGSMTPTAPPDPVVAPTTQPQSMDQQGTPVTQAPVELPKAEPSKAPVIILVALVVLLAAVAAAYFAGLFG